MTIFCRRVEDEHGVRIYIDKPSGGGEAWVIESDRQLEISIEPLGSSRIPRCEAIEERVRADSKWPPKKETT